MSNLEPAAHSPTYFIIIRHAEKTGKLGDRGLSFRGMERAQYLAIALPRYFGRIGTIIAAKSTERSTRPVATVLPIAKTLGLPIDDRWATTDYAALAKTLLAKPHDGHVLICWRHKTLEQLAQALGARQAPAWPETLYERIWAVNTNFSSQELKEHCTELTDAGVKIYPSEPI